MRPPPCAVCGYQAKRTFKQPKSKGLRWLAGQFESGDPSECWVWPFSTVGGGYGQVFLCGRRSKATHAAMHMAGIRRPPSPNNNALHSCDNPPCCNPNHLRWGSLRQNTEDKIERGRQPLGEEVHTTILTEDQVVEIYMRFRRELPIQHRIERRQMASCGTEAGYYRHRRLGEPQCSPCKSAHAALQRITRKRKKAA